LSDNLIILPQKEVGDWRVEIDQYPNPQPFGYALRQASFDKPFVRPFDRLRMYSGQARERSISTLVVNSAATQEILRRSAPQNDMFMKCQQNLIPNHLLAIKSLIDHAETYIFMNL
jgi:hypothetical protein